MSKVLQLLNNIWQKTKEILKTGAKGVEKVALFVDNYKHAVDPYVAILLALIPILQHYVGPLFNAAITVLAVIAVYLILRIIPELRSFRLSKISLVWLMIIYQVYRIINHGTSMTEFGQSAVFIVFMIAVALGKVNVRFTARIAKLVCMVASICLFIQYFCFYLFEYHVQFVPTSLLISSAEQWILGAQTGLAGITGRLGSFYRPSAFFLEPSHVYLYMFPILILTLFEGKFDREAMWSGILISCGIVLTTSAMGIAAVVGVWSLFFLLRDERDGSFAIKNIIRVRNLIAMGILLVLFVLAAIYVPFLRRAVTRVFRTATGATAITGRVSRALEMIASMKPLQWFFGVADNTHGMSFNIPGSLGALYRHGLIGFVLSYELYVKCICKLSLPYKLVGLVLIVTSFFSAHTHSTVGMLYYLLILMGGFQGSKVQFSGIQPYRMIRPRKNRR